MEKGSAIEVINFTKTYKLKGKILKAVNDVTLLINVGDVFGLVGRNGAGKTTIIKAIMGFIKPSYGNILVLGKSPATLSVKNAIGFVPENPFFPDNITGRDWLQFCAKIREIDERAARIKISGITKEFDLIDAIDRPVKKYSKGMVQKLAFCSAIMHDPKLLILDEPMSGLDPLARHQLKNKLREISSAGGTIFFCSHILSDVEHLCNRVAIIDKGYIRKVKEVTPDTDVEALFVESLKYDNSMP